MLTQQEIKRLRSLHLRKYRRKYGEYLVEGYRLVQAAWKARAPIQRVLVAESRRRDPEMARLLHEVEVPVEVLPDRVFSKLSGVQHSQGILAVVWCHLVEASALWAVHKVLLLDGVQDPGNVGTIIRSAAWFGVGGVLAGPGTADFFNPKVVRATMGGLWDVQLAVTDDPASWLKQAGEQGRVRYAADLEGTEVTAWKPAPGGVLILGSEAHGIGEALRAEIDERVTIPPFAALRGVESLNVAVAGSILIYRWATGER